MRSTPDQTCSFVLSGVRQGVDPTETPSRPRATQHQREPNLHLAPHLREVCAMLAAGLVRLRAHSAEDLARDAEQARARGESSLHFQPEQSGCVPTPTRRHA
jgi:hypothetical protein